MDRARGTTNLVWILVSLPGLALGLVLIYTVFARLGYPYDLEWMEGGLLDHAARLADGQGVYVEPSVEFIPYLYTPLYPGLLAALGQLFGISYQLGRVISILSMIGVLVLIGAAIIRPNKGLLRSPAKCGSVLAVGLFAATYPWVEGWYDIVRADTLFLVMAIGGIMMVRAFARTGRGPNGQLQIAAAAAMLSFSFFAKQTGVFYVAIGGGLLLFYNWRRLPIFVAVSGVIGLGGTWLLNRVTDQWFWTYIYEIHQSHDFNSDRVIASFGHILFHFPVMTGVIVLGLGTVLVVAISTKRLPQGAEPLLMWTVVFAGSTVLGAVAWGTQWAHFNAYIPAMATGAIAAGCALPAIVGSLDVLYRRLTRWGIPVGVAVGYAVAGALAWQLLEAWWMPGRFIPSKDDRKAGNALVKRISEVEGEVFIPYHPWYGHLAGKQTYAHRMGLLDVSVGKKTWPVAGIREAFRNHYFDAVILDNRPVRNEFPGLRGPYRIDEFTEVERSPRVFTGAGAAHGPHKLVPHSIWVPAVLLQAPRDVRVIENFESGRYEGWQRSGTAWGTAPTSRALKGQGVVSRYGGRFYATSFHGGDSATGSMTSPEFEITGHTITFRLSGGRDIKRLRIELWVDGKVVREATGHKSERMREVVWSVSPYTGQTGKLRVVDDSDETWGHLNIDELWLHEHD